MTARQLYEKERLLAHATRAVNVKSRVRVADFQRLELPGEDRTMVAVWMLRALVILALVFIGCTQKPKQNLQHEPEPAPDMARSLETPRDPSCERARMVQDRLGEQIDADNHNPKLSRDDREYLLENMHALDDYTHTAGCQYVWSSNWQPSKRAERLEFLRRSLADKEEALVHYLRRASELPGEIQTTRKAIAELGARP